MGNNVQSSDTGIRTRFFPKNRIGHGLVSAAPWLDIMLLLLCFVILESKFVLVRGAVIDLPDQSFSRVLPTDMIAIVKSAEGADPGVRKEIIFFDDERFLVANTNDMERLRTSLQDHVNENNQTGLLIYSDTAVKYGTSVKLYSMAREVGIKKVNLATRPEASVE